MNELPDFDIQPPETTQVPPKKPRPKPAKKAVRKKPAVAVPPVRKRVPKKRMKPATPQHLAEEMKMDFAAFIKAVYGFELEPWQVRLLKALEKRK